MRVWRLCRARHAKSAFDGEGARLFAGRWHRRGTRVVYTSSSLALAAIELLVHFDHEDAPSDYVSIPCDLPDDLPLETVDVAALPRGWRASPPPEALQDMGSAWVERGRSAALRVPSAVIAEEANYLLDPTHPDFGRCRVGTPRPFAFDDRLLRQP